MEQQIIRNCVVAERLARGLANYYERRTLGVRCPDPLPPQERSSTESAYCQRLHTARRFIEGLRA